MFRQRCLFRHFAAISSNWSYNLRLTRFLYIFGIELPPLRFTIYYFLQNSHTVFQICTLVLLKLDCAYSRRFIFKSWLSFLRTVVWPILFKRFDEEDAYDQLIVFSLFRDTSWTFALDVARGHFLTVLFLLRGTRIYNCDWHYCIRTLLFIYDSSITLRFIIVLRLFINDILLVDDTLLHLCSKIPLLVLTA